MLDELADAIFRAKPSDRGSFIACIKQYLDGSLRKTIDSHNTDSVIFRFVCEGRQLLLKAEYGSLTATHKEADWYEYLKTIAPEKQGLYVGSVRSDMFASVLLEYVKDAATLDEWALANPAGHEPFGDWLLSMLEYDMLLFSLAVRTVPKDAVARSLASKYDARRKEASAVQYLDSLFAKRHITINERDYLTPDHALRRLLSSKHIRDQLIPDSVGFIHGDLHTGNALIKNETLYYVDPNGSFELPLEYDIAKMLHSVHGLYPVIMRGAFRVVRLPNGGYDFELEQEPIYSAAHNRLRNVLDNEQYVRSAFMEAMHFATMLPHHAKNQHETTALFLRSVQLFDELLALLN